MGLDNLNPGRYLATVFVADVSEGTTQNGAPFLGVTLLGKKPNSGKIIAKVWNCRSVDFPPIGSFIQAHLEVKPYNNSISYVVKGFNVLTEEENIEDYLIMPPIPREEMYNYMIQACNLWKSESLRTLVFYILQKYNNKFMWNAAAKTIHHTCIGGLLWHSYRMLKMAVNNRDLYVGCNTDLIEAGCILHDIGKVKELDTSIMGVTEYTKDGVLFGHLLLGCEIVTSAWRDLCFPENSEELMCLKHIIASHHSKREYGAIAIPAIKEALIVSQLDSMDAKSYQFDEESQKISPGEVSGKIFGLDTKIYRPDY